MFPQCSKNHITLRTPSMDIPNDGGKGSMIFNLTFGFTAYPIQLEGWVLPACAASLVKCWNWCFWVVIYIWNKVQYQLRFLEAWYMIRIHPSPPSQDEVAQMSLQCSKNCVTLQTLLIDIPNNGGKMFHDFWFNTWSYGISYLTGGTNVTHLCCKPY